MNLAHAGDKAMFATLHSENVRLHGLHTEYSEVRLTSTIDSPNAGAEGLTASGFGMSTLAAKPLRDVHF